MRTVTILMASIWLTMSMTSCDKAKKKLKVSGRRTKITVGGKKAKRSKLKTGMSCTFVYKGSSAKKIACM